jgi:dynein assembly factor 5, axonemal
MMLILVKDIVNKTKELFTPFVQDACQIIQRALLDTFPDIRKEACVLIKSLSDSVPKELSLQGGTICKSLLPSLHHRHSAVRNSALKALASALLVDASEIDDCSKSLYSMLQDKSSLVREQLFTTTMDLLTKLIDRHVYGYKLLPILYGGLSDDMQKLSLLCKDYLDQVGSQFEKENAARVKDELDYTDGIDIPNRPTVGSRYLARDNIQKIVQHLVSGLGDWNVETRYKSAQTFCNFLSYAESHITGYTANILPAAYKILAQDEKHVMDQTINLMERIGFYINPDTILMLILPNLSSGGPGISTFRLGCLRALRGVLLGTPTKKISSNLQAIFKCFSDAELIQNDNFLILLELSKCLLCLGCKLTDERAINFEYFYLLIQLKSVTGNDKMIGYKEMLETVLFN